MSTMQERPVTHAGALAGTLRDDQLLACPDWAAWMAVEAPFATVGYSAQSVQTRFERNGYEWDVHGTLLVPDREVMPGVAFVMTHGGAGSEFELLETPDKRPGLAAVLASQGFRVLSVTWVGHHHPDGRWAEPVAQRLPIYLFDRALPAFEITERMLRCTYNVTVEGIARLADMTLAGHTLLSFGHSTGGPMSVSLQRFLKYARIGGIVGWASGGPDGWYREWLMWMGAKQENVVPLDNVARRTARSFRSAGYEGDAQLCPWGGAEGYMRWGDEYKSQLKTAVCENQHKANIPILEECARLTGLPVAEFVDHLRDPDPDWLARTPVLLLLGENDKNHWYYGEGVEAKLETFMGRKFEQRTPRTKVVCLPRYGHYGYVERYNEKIAYLYLWALAGGFFDEGLNG